MPTTATFRTVWKTRLRKVKHRSAREICEATLDNMLTFSAAADDITLVIVKRRYACGNGALHGFQGRAGPDRSGS